MESSARAKSLLVPNNEMQVYRVNGQDVREMNYLALKDHIRQVKKTGDIYIQFARPGTALDAEVVNISLRRTTRTDEFLAVLPTSQADEADTRRYGYTPATTSNSNSDSNTSAGIDMPRLRALAFEGIPDNDVSAGLRAKVWRVLLDYLPHNKPQEWESEQNRARRLYQQLVDECVSVHQDMLFGCWSLFVFFCFFCFVVPDLAKS